MKHDLIPLSFNKNLFNKKLKILIIIPCGIPIPVKLYGGIERIAYSHIEYLSQAGHEVVVLAHPDSTGPFRLIPFTYGESRYYKKAGLKTLIGIREIIKKEQPDIVHDFSQPALSMLCPYNIPLICSMPALPQMRYIYPLLWRQPNTVMVGCSHHLTKQATALLQRKTIYNSVEYQKYTPVYQVPKGAPLVYLGRVELDKGVHIAIKIAQKTGEKLIIAGNISPNAQNYFDTQVTPHLNDQISYVGPLDDAGKNELLGKAKAFIFPLQVQEAFGITVAESMACGTPVIAFPYGSMPELIKEGVTGFVCHTEDEMAVKIASIPQLSRSACRQSVEERFSVRQMSEQYLHAYYELLSERAPRSL